MTDNSNMQARYEKWESRRIRSDEMDPAQLLAHPYNPVIHPREQTEAVKGSLNELGWLGHIKVNLRTDEAWGDEQNVQTVFDGHDRIKAAMETGQATVPVDFYDLTPEEEHKAIVYLRETATMAVYDPEPLAFVLERAGQTNEPALSHILANLAEAEGIVPPEFEPVAPEDQSPLDAKNKIECPECGHEFTP